MKTKTILFALSVLLGGATAAPLAAESASHAAVRGQIARFWQIAEERVAEPLPSLPGPDVGSETVVVERGPVRRLGYTACPPDSIRVVRTAPATPSPAPVVEVEQRVDQREEAGHFGLSILGGLQLFDFQWGESSESATDGLRGRLPGQ
ncbi:MAG: hypothetical protein ACLFU2_14710 [Opitutales bacterium]